MRYFLLSFACAAGLLLAGCSSLTKRLLVGSPQVRAGALAEVRRADEKTRKKMALRMKAILADRGSRDRLAAANVLENLGQAAAPALPELMGALAGRDLVAFSAARTLSKLDAAAPALVEALKSPDAELHREAARILPAQGALAAPLLALNLEGADPALAKESADILGEAGSAAKDAVPALVNAAFSGDKDLKISASSALEKIGPPAGTWLGAALQSPDAERRYQAAWVLANMFPPLPEALLPLGAALADPDGRVAGAAARALGLYPPETQAHFPEEVLSNLYRGARGTDEETRGWASIALVKAGAPVEKLLVKELKAADPAVRAGAAKVISLMFPPPAEVLEAVVAALKDAELPVRLAAAEALGNYAMTDPALFSADAVRNVAEAMKDKAPELRATLIFPLSRLAKNGGQAAEALLGALKDKDLDVKRSATSALWGIGPDAKKALPVLLEQLKSRDCSLRVLSARALIQIDPAFKNKPAVAAAETVCPGVKTNPAIEPLTLEAEFIGATTGSLQLP